MVSKNWEQFLFLLLVLKANGATGKYMHVLAGLDVNWKTSKSGVIKQGASKPHSAMVVGRTSLL